MTTTPNTPDSAMQTNDLQTRAVVFEEPGRLALTDLALNAPDDHDVVVDVDFSGISTGTERLLWTGTMPPFPGLSYPLVPGYETVGHIVSAGDGVRDRIGQRVFVSGANCYGDDVRGLFGGSASRLVVNADKALTLPDTVHEQGTLLALAATALHAMNASPATDTPVLIIGHGVLGRLLARIALARSGVAPTVWEINPQRFSGAQGYEVLSPDDDTCRAYRAIYDVSGDANIVDSVIDRLAPQGEVILAGFYSKPVSFAFPPTFMREMRLRVAAEWQPADLIEVQQMIVDKRLSLDGLITHTVQATDAHAAYETAFGDPLCLKMVMDWRALR